MAREHMRSWRVGEVTITRIVQLWDFQDHINMTVVDAEPADALALPWLRPHYVTADGRQRMNFQGFAVQAPGLTLMVDTCIGNGRERPWEVFSHLETSYLADLASIGIGRDDVDLVMCTHLHHDHIGWNTMRDGDRWVPTFPSARYLFAQREVDGWEALRAHGGHDVRHLEDSFDPIVAAGLAEFVATDHCLSPELRLEPSHGHTPGHVHVRISSGGEEAVITGDLMHHPIQCAMPHRHATFDLDRPTGAATRVAFVERYADSGVLIIGAHFADPTAGWIRRAEGEVRFVGLEEQPA